VKKEGIFIYIEGLDGSGKTTHAHRLVRNLQSKGFDAIYTTEPSRGQLGKFIREIILEQKKRVPRVIEAILFAVDRVEHFEKDVKPALDKGKIVVSDRSVYSSLAYQGATGLDLEWIKKINHLVLTSDLAFYLNVPPEVVIKRIHRKKSVMERLDIQIKVEEIYLKFVSDGELMAINGDRKKSEVERDLLNNVLHFLGK
jgi:dTMP kinase